MNYCSPNLVGRIPIRYVQCPTGQRPCGVWWTLSSGRVKLYLIVVVTLTETTTIALMWVFLNYPNFLVPINLVFVNINNK